MLSSHQCRYKAKALPFYLVFQKNNNSFKNISHQLFENIYHYIGKLLKQSFFL